MHETEIEAALGAMVRAGRLAGAATIVWRDGEVVEAPAAGWRDVEAALPIERTTLFRIASMTKPITSVAALSLFEDGGFRLDEPISGWAPEFGQMRVLRSPDGSLDTTDAATRPVTFGDLLTHRSGLTYGSFHDGPIADAYRDALGGDIDSPVRPDDWIANLAGLPLIDQPGARLHYGRSTDLLGLLIARIEAASLGAVLERRVLGPLGMIDTGFGVPAEKADRRAGLYGFDDDGRLAPREVGPDGSTVIDRPADMPYESGGQGLWSTVNDYLSFARLFVGGGAVDGVRIVQPETLALMTSNCLTPEQRVDSEVRGVQMFAAGHGFGMGVAVVMEPASAEPIICSGGVGAVGWPGAFGGWWTADPGANTVLIFLAHNVIELDQFGRGIGFGVYDAITAFQALALAPRATGSRPAATAG